MCSLTRPTHGGYPDAPTPDIRMLDEELVDTLARENHGLKRKSERDRNQYFALAAENARLREELSTADHRARQRTEEAVGHYIGALRTANATIALLECVNERLRGCAVAETDTETAAQDTAFLDGLVTEKYALQRQLRAEKAAAVSIRNEVATLRAENADLRRALAATALENAR